MKLHAEGVTRFQDGGEAIRFCRLGAAGWGDSLMTVSGIEDWFDKARTLAARGNLVVVRGDGQCLILPALAKASVKPQMVAAMERMIPSTPKRNVAVIADTSWATSTSLSLQVANQSIPFFG